jgi:transposase
MVRGMIGDATVSVVADTGASGTFVSSSLMARLKLGFNARASAQYRTVAADPLDTLGIARIVLRLGGRKLNLIAHVVETSLFDVLLPAPVLARLGALIDMWKRTIRLRRLRVTLRTQEMPSMCGAFAASVDENMFVFERTPEYERVRRLYARPTKESIESRLKLAESAPPWAKQMLTDMLSRLWKLAREYPKNAPPLLPLRSIRLPFKEGAKPPHVKQFPLSNAMRFEKEQQIGEWKVHRICAVSVSFGNLPLFLVAKGDGSWRIVIDAREANEVLEEIRHNPPLLSDVHSWANGAQWVSSIDAAAFFHQFPIDLFSGRFFAFTAGKHGRVQMCRLPQGSSVAPAIASAFLEMVLRPVADLALSYVDNIIIRTMSANPEDHLRDVQRVLRCLHGAGVTLNLASSTWFGRENVPMLGVRWSVGETRLTDKRVADVLKMPRPLKLAQVRSMVAAVSTMASFIPFAQLLAAPFNRLCGAAKAFKWNADLEKSWQAIRRAVTHTSVLHHPEPKEKLVLRSDASLVGWGAVVYVVRNGVELPIGYASRAWKGAERNYSAVHREACGLLAAVKKLQPYLKGEDVRFETDSSAVAKILSHQGDDALGRIGLQLSELGVKREALHHVPGKENGVADWLSRVPAVGPVALAAVEDTLAVPLHLPGKHESGLITRDQQLADDELKELIELCEAQNNGDVCDPREALMRDTVQRYLVRDGLLMRIELGSEASSDGPLKFVVVVPKAGRKRVLEYVHRAFAHARGRRFIEALRERYWFRGLVTEASEWTRKCHACQLTAHAKTVNVGQGVREPEGVGRHVYLDIGHVGQDGATSKTQFLVMMDQASGLIAAAPLEDRTAGHVISAFHSRWVRPYGPPARVTVDGAPEFTSAALRDYCQRWGIRVIVTSPYNPQANLAEAAVKKVKEGLRRAHTSAEFDPHLKGAGWTQLLDAVVHAWNGASSDAQDKHPNEVFFGRTVRHYADADAVAVIPVKDTESAGSTAELIRQEAAERREIREQRRHAYFDRQSQRIVHPMGSMVLRYLSVTHTLGKATLRATGPYRVIGRTGEVTYKLANLDGTEVEGYVHARWLRPYIGEEADVPQYVRYYAPGTVHASFGGAKAKEQPRKRGRPASSGRARGARATVAEPTLAAVPEPAPTPVSAAAPEPTSATAPTPAAAPGPAVTPAPPPEPAPAPPPEPAPAPPPEPAPAPPPVQTPAIAPAPRAEEGRHARATREIVTPAEPRRSERLRLVKSAGKLLRIMRFGGMMVRD